MKGFITFNVALSMFSFDKEVNINSKTIKLIDLYLSGDIDLYIELNGKHGRKSFPYSRIGEPYNAINDLDRLMKDGKIGDIIGDILTLAEDEEKENLPKKLNDIVFSAAKKIYYSENINDGVTSYTPINTEKKVFTSGHDSFAHKRDIYGSSSSAELFDEDDLYSLEGIYKVPLEYGQYCFHRFRTITTYGEDEKELRERGINLALGGIDRVESLDGQLWTLYSNNLDKAIEGVSKENLLYPDIVFPDLNSFLLSNQQALAINQEGSKTKKRPMSTNRHEDTRRSVLDAAFYELANNYENCLKNGEVRAAQIAESIYENSKTHWPDGCKVNQRSTKTSPTPLEVNTMADHIRKIINIKKS
ncbi:hypothetical protein [Pseudoalteromonas sp. APC 3691]|uniref:hypothetical protein n=1 Tax=Pseudoalteromonas sp. APC 3691 TaxID=3035173 RepID=UPI0025B49EC4|nr:hypothetical protein [Pseudoalteromonas sp. APC 3691]MDN3390162.1 hypothetical protein [Pseudoalteromonas sp. APC 3691]